VTEDEGREVGRRSIEGHAVVAVHGDLTTQRVGAVVNAANSQLAHGGGVAKALANAGGAEVQRESNTWVRMNGPVGPGQAAVTTAGQMRAERVIHVVGPMYQQDQDNEGLLAQAVRAALDAADEEGLASVALPAISAGIYGYPPAEAARVIAAEATRWLRQAPASVTEVRLVGVDAASAQQFADAF
jgi:O-acetyl-ADP-ribose deacetylase (regulator of RNase III)